MRTFVGLYRSERHHSDGAGNTRSCSLESALSSVSSGYNWEMSLAVVLIEVSEIQYGVVFGPSDN